jgi:integrase/recombinase XerD
MKSVAGVGSLQWSEEQQQSLQAHLTGFWMQDVWTFPRKDSHKRQSPLSFRFTCISPQLRTELKYALWQKFACGDWQHEMGDEGRVNEVKHINEWLSAVAPTTCSFLEKSLDQWEISFRSYLVERHLYNRHKTRVLHSSQTYLEKWSEDRRICLLRQVYTLVYRVYDDRPETEKEIWDLKALGLKVNPTVGTRYLSFIDIAPLWLRQLTQVFMGYNIAVHAPGDCFNKLQSCKIFARYVMTRPDLHQAGCIDRAIIVDFMRWLCEEQLPDQYRGRILRTLRTVFKVCAQHLQQPAVSQEVLILDSDFPKWERALPREIPEEVLEQLRQHLDALPTTVLRMVVILLEVGLRLSELCTLTPSCLICDDKHEWYLQSYQFKSKKEHIIPLVNQHVIGAIQAQQQEIRQRFGADWPYLFPRPRNAREPFQQGNFARALNQWALEHAIRDRNGRAWRFQSHQFRHTVGMRLINDDVPLEVISRLFGHDSMRMTETYARKRAENIRQELERVQRHRKTVDYQGRMVKGDPRANDPDAQMARRGVRGQTLAVGGCGRLMVLGDCNHANKCLTCPMWLTSTDDLLALKSFYERAVHLKQRAVETGNQLVIRQQEHIIANLAIRITSLEETVMDGTLCVDDVLAQLRSDLASATSGLEEAKAAGLILAVKHLERIVVDLKARMKALEETT